MDTDGNIHNTNGYNVTICNLTWLYFFNNLRDMGIARIRDDKESRLTTIRSKPPPLFAPEQDN